MVQPGLGGLDTPRTNAGDATYIGRPPEFDVSQEMSFMSPTKDGNIFDQLRNGGRPNLRTPRGSGERAPLSSRQNLPEGIGGVEFTPLLKSATRNSARRGHRGKENGKTSAVPLSLGKIDEDDTTMPLPGAMDMSTYGVARNMSYVESTPLPHIDTSSIASTPVAMQLRSSGKDTGGPLLDGNQLSLREQENVIDRIEKENFGLKLKIHFLEEALRKAGPGFSDAALKENTELKVDKVTLQRELQRCKKLLISAEQSLENYRQEMLNMQEKMTTRETDKTLHAELERLRDQLATKEADFDALQRKADEQSEKTRDEIDDLEAELREKDRIISQKEDELEDLQVSMEARMEEDHERIAELEEKASSSSGEKLDEAKDTIVDLEADIRRLEQQVDDMKEKLDDAINEKNRAEDDLEELQEEMANKSVHTKGLSRQVEEKVARLQSEVDKSQHEYKLLEQKHEEQQKEAEDLKLKLKESRQARDTAEREALSATSQWKEAQADLNMARDQKVLLQTRHDTLTTESATLQREVLRLQKTVAQLEGDLELERQHSDEAEQDIKARIKDEFERLNKHIIDLQTEISEKEHLYDIDSEKWETDREHLKAERNRLQSTVDRLRETEGALSSNEAQLQELQESERLRHESAESALRRQLEKVQAQLDTRQGTLDGLRKELAAVRDELRKAQLDSQSAKKKSERLEDEVTALQRSLEREADRSRHDKETAQKERDILRQELEASRASGKSEIYSAKTVTTLQDLAASAAREHREQMDRMRTQLTKSAAEVSQSAREKHDLQDQLANLNVELHSLRASLTEVKAERDEAEEQLRRTHQSEGDTFRIDQERIDLRMVRAKLDVEVRRLREENKTLADQCKSLETTLEEELEKAANEEERLGQEVRELQSLRLRSSATETQELQAARRTIRDLERRIEEYEVAAITAAPLRPPATAVLDDTDTGELSVLRRDLAAARAKERDYVQREAMHKDAVKTLRRQITDLERAAHEANLNQLMRSPETTQTVASVMSPTSSAAQRAEIIQLREQLIAAHQSVAELKRSIRDAERRATASTTSAENVEARIREVEEERAILEQALDDAQEAAAEVNEAHETALHRIQSKLERYRHERDELALALADAQHSKNGSDSESVSSEMSREERSNLHAMLRKTQIEAEALEQDLRDHRSALDEAVRTEEALRIKLERARSERSAYRADAERLQREVSDMQQTVSQTKAALHYGTVSDPPTNTRELVLAAAASSNRHNGEADTDALVRASEEQSIRHRKELRGLNMQVDWMQARWEREARLRSGAVLGKQFAAQDLEMRIACNKVDLQMLQEILHQLGVKQPALLSANSGTVSKSKACAVKTARKTLRRAVLAVQFVVRAQRSANFWAQQEAARQRLAAAAEGVRRDERMQKMRTAWRKQLATVASAAIRQ